MNILIVGASGKTGEALLTLLQKTSHSVTGLVRTEEQEEKVHSLGATTLFGDLDHGLHGLLTPFHAIFFVAGSRGKDVEGVDYQGLARLADDAQRAGIKRFLYIGSINAGKSPERFIEELQSFYNQQGEPVPEGLLANTKKAGYHHYVKMKEKAEQHLIHSGLNYTILRAGLLTQEKGSGCVNVIEGMSSHFGKISRENVASCFINALETPETFHKTYTILDGDTPISNAF